MSKLPSGKMYHGSTTVGTSAAMLENNESALVFGVLIKAKSDNAGIVYIGARGVTANTLSTRDGMPLEAGDSLFLEMDSLHKVYAKATIANQKVFYNAI